MASTPNIIGIGRCAIGLLRKNVLLDQQGEQPVLFDRHYILNPFSCIQSIPSSSRLMKLKQYQCRPSLEDQLHCLDHISNYQICVIEIFPPSKLYHHKDLDFAVCFESFSKDLQDEGFSETLIDSPDYLVHLDPENYTSNLSQLIKLIRLKNESIQIILLNAELMYDQEGNQLSSPLLHPIMANIKKTIIGQQKQVALLDINDTLAKLSAKGLCFFDTAFPLLYIRHKPNLHPIAVARDCKHASPLMRKYFTRAFYNLLMDKGYALSSIGSCIPPPRRLPGNYRERVQGNLERHHSRNYSTSDIINEFRDSRSLSMYTGYLLEDMEEDKNLYLDRYIKVFPFHVLRNTEDLITYLYHLRTITAYLYQQTPPLLASLCHIGVQVVFLAQPNDDRYLPYVILWLKNIFLAARKILDANKQLSPQLFIILIERLEQKKHLHKHEVIKQLLSFKEPYNQSDIAAKPSRYSLQKIRRIAIFLPRSNPFYITMFFGLKRAFEKLGVEVHGWPELLAEDALLEFCRQSKPDLIFEMNRSRKQLPKLPQNILHACWIVDLMGNDFSYFQDSDIIYTFTALWLQAFPECGKRLIDWLPPGIDPQLYYPATCNYRYDFSFIGHIPPPWTNEELERPLYSDLGHGINFGDYINKYDQQWGRATQQRTPPEALNLLMQRNALLNSKNQEIDIEDLTLRYDILCRSRRMNVRKATIDAVLPTSDSIAIFGSENWKKWPKYSGYYKKFIEDPNQLREIYQHSRINLHEGVGLHMRSLDCFASGGNLLYMQTDERNSTGTGLALHFEKNIHYFELDKNDFTYQIRLLLNDETRLRSIGQEAAKITHAKHSWLERAKKILTDAQAVTAY